MIHDVVQIMLARYDKETFALYFMECFDALKGSDVSFEMIASNTLQPFMMFYQHNIVTYSIAYIFLHTRVSQKLYEGAEARAEIQQKLFKEVLEFDEIIQYDD